MRMAFPVALETYIQKEVTIKDQISALKNDVNAIAKDAVDAKKASVDALKSQVNSNITALDAITDANAVAKKTEVKEKLENHLKTLDEIDHVLQIKKNVVATPEVTTHVENDPEKKGNFLTNYLHNVTSKDEWKKEPILNASRVIA
jgi:ABC-type Fe3+-citrate transport system substrate-binding protein